MIEPEIVDIMRGNLPESVIQTILIGRAMDKFWAETPIDPDEIDLNPHLYVAQVCEDIAKQVASHKVACTKEDVMLYWLTMAIHYGYFLPKPEAHKRTP